MSLPAAQEFAKRVTAQLTQTGQSRITLLAHLGPDLSYGSRLLRGHHTPRPARLAYVAHLLHTTSHALWPHLDASAPPLSQRLFALMRAQQWSHAALASRLQWSAWQLTRLLQTGGLPRGWTLGRLADALELDRAWLIHGQLDDPQRTLPTGCLPLVRSSQLPYLNPTEELPRAILYYHAWSGHHSPTITTNDFAWTVTDHDLIADVPPGTPLHISPGRPAEPGTIGLIRDLQEHTTTLRLITLWHNYLALAPLPPANGPYERLGLNHQYYGAVIAHLDPTTIRSGDPRSHQPDRQQLATARLHPGPGRPRRPTSDSPISPTIHPFPSTTRRPAS